MSPSNSFPGSTPYSGADSADDHTRVYPVSPSAVDPAAPSAPVGPSGQAPVGRYDVPQSYTQAPQSYGQQPTAAPVQYAGQNQQYGQPSQNNSQYAPPPGFVPKERKPRNLPALMAFLMSIAGFFLVWTSESWGWIFLGASVALALVAFFFPGRGKGLAGLAIVISIVGAVVGGVLFAISSTTSFIDGFDFELPDPGDWDVPSVFDGDFFDGEIFGGDILNGGLGDESLLPGHSEQG